MPLGFVSTRPQRPPSGADRHLWRAACNNAPYGYDGLPEEEPWVACRLAELRAELTREHHQAVPLAQAHITRDRATLDYRSADAQAQRVDAETAPHIEAGRVARRNRGDQHARHERAEGARALFRRSQAYDLRDGAQRTAEGHALGFQAASGAVTDRLHIRATEAVARMTQYITLLNDRRFAIELPPLPALPLDLADRVVLEAGRRVGDARPGAQPAH